MSGIISNSYFIYKTKPCLENLGEKQKMVAAVAGVRIYSLSHTNTRSHVCMWIRPGCVTCPIGPPDGPQTVHMLIPKLNDPSAQ